MLSRLVITFLLRSKRLLISWLQSPSIVILESKKIKSVMFPLFSQLPWSDGTRCHDLHFWMLSFKSAFSFSPFTFIKRLFSFFSLSAIRVVASAYLRFLIFFPAVLIPACASLNPTFRMMYLACKLNKHGDNIRPWCTPFPVWNQFYVQFYLLLLELYTEFSGGRSGGLVFPSL